MNLCDIIVQTRVAMTTSNWKKRERWKSFYSAHSSTDWWWVWWRGGRGVEPLAWLHTPNTYWWMVGWLVGWKRKKRERGFCERVEGSNQQQQEHLIKLALSFSCVCLCVCIYSDSKEEKANSHELRVSLVLCNEPCKNKNLSHTHTFTPFVSCVTCFCESSPVQCSQFFKNICRHQQQSSPLLLLLFLLLIGGSAVTRMSTVAFSFESDTHAINSNWEKEGKRSEGGGYCVGERERDPLVIQYNIILYTSNINVLMVVHGPFFPPLCYLCVCVWNRWIVALGGGSTRFL